MHESSRPKLSIAIFIAILCVILYLANLVVYEVISNIFSITTTGQLWVLGIALGVGSASLIVSTIVGMRSYNLVTRIYSTISAVWTGFFVYLFFTSVIYGIVIMIFPTTSRTFGLILLLVAILAAIYAILHARTIHIVNQKVSLNNLPPSWNNKKAVFISDLHLGQIHGSKYAAKIAEKINKIKPDIVFIGGDLFDGTSAPDLHVMIAPLKELTSTYGTYFITGNHEEFGKDTIKFLDAVRSIGIRVIQDEVVEIDGLQIVGVDYVTTSEREGFKNVLSRLSINKDKVSILLKHEPKNIDIAHDAGISLQLSGHTHRAQLWPLEYIARRLYGKFTYGLQNMGNTQVFTSSGAGTWGPPMRVGTNCEIVVLELINPGI